MYDKCMSRYSTGGDSSEIQPLNEELSTPGLDLVVPDISKPCIMFFPWTSASLRRTLVTHAEPTRSSA